MWGLKLQLVVCKNSIFRHSQGPCVDTHLSALLKNCLIRSTKAPGFLNSHSQMRRTRNPSARSCLHFRASRLRLPTSLSDQNDSLFNGSLTFFPDFVFDFGGHARSSHLRKPPSGRFYSRYRVSREARGRSIGTERPGLPKSLAP